MFFTRTLGAVLLTSLVAGVACAASKTEKTLNVTATIPAAQPKLQFDGNTDIEMKFNADSNTLDAATKAFTISGNSGLSIYLQQAPVLKHESQDNTIGLKVSVNPAGDSAKKEKLGTTPEGAFILRKASEIFDVNESVRGTLQIEPAEQTKIETTRVGKYTGDVTVVVEANDTDEPVRANF